MVQDDGAATPMIVFYEDGKDECGSKDLSGKGNCSDDGSWDESHVQEVTTCTIDAVRTTFEEHWG
jgi:hypothetical protein